MNWKLLAPPLLLFVSIQIAVGRDVHINYQGFLRQGGVVADGPFDVRFTLFDDAAIGAQVGASVTNDAVEIEGGVFTTAFAVPLDDLRSQPRFLEVAVRAAGMTTDFVVLSPRQRLGETPYAAISAVAESAQTLDAGESPMQTILAANKRVAIFEVLPDVVAAELPPGGEGYSDAVNVVTGSPGNQVATGTVGATIGGGGGVRSFKDAEGTPGVSDLRNSAGGDFATIGGGAGNTANAGDAVIGGGRANRILANGFSSTVSGGFSNSIESGSSHSTIGGGARNVIRPSVTVGTISGGEGNEIQENQFYGTIGGGADNTIAGGALGATIGGGFENIIRDEGGYGVIPGGRFNSIDGIDGFAAGVRASVQHDNVFLWSDSSPGTFHSITNNEFAVRAAGGMRVESARGVRLDDLAAPLITRSADPFGNTAPTHKRGLGRWGVFMEANPVRLTLGMPALGGREIQFVRYATDGTPTKLMGVDQSGNLTTSGSINPISDREQKTNFAAVDPIEVLERLRAVPIELWTYKSDANNTRHLGPMAQDFHAAFGVGLDDRHIATVDADGVAFAAIQGLDRKLEKEVKERDARIAQLEARVEMLSAEIRRLIHNQAGQSLEASESED